MNFDFRQQLKGWLTGGFATWIAARYGLPLDVSVAVGVAAGGLVDVIYWLLFVPKRGAFLFALALVLLLPSAVHAQATQIRIGGAWSPRHGFSERLSIEPFQWRIRDVAGRKGFDLQPFTWGSPSSRSMGGGLFWETPAARNAWLRVGPEIEFRQGSKPAFGLFIGATIDVFGGR